ncbi:head-tail adaptor protein [Celeribacter indicus]|uniref:Phage head-tail adaptor n=1 Tax=Celeribacter indicus TaxID=1208324 RepID=A0A0B5DS92_9RHOB|nr:head-tail adaptor protein [Celeribacter indicus]AJE46403.1 hypothetical protein P73_1688 [Celeribacter indicus]SDW55777.1 head-tail adaptor [Celeribacter indicus]
MAAPVHLNRRLLLEGALRLPDGAGGHTEVWQALGALWAAIGAGRGSERPAEAVTVSRLPVRVVLRAAPVGSPRRPKPGQRFVEGGRKFRILSVGEHDPQGRYLVCEAREEVAS